VYIARKDFKSKEMFPLIQVSHLVHLGNKNVCYRELNMNLGNCVTTNCAIYTKHGRVIRAKCIRVIRMKYTRLRWAGYVVWLNVTSQGNLIYAGHVVTSGRALGRAGYVARIDKHNGELYDFYISHSLVRIVGTRRLQWTGPVT
jgi:hypothetical protein